MVKSKRKLKGITERKVKDKRKGNVKGDGKWNGREN
jgi:hypothetical protein